MRRKPSANKNTQKPPANKNACFISEKVIDGLRHTINQNVCQELPTRLFNGKYYCVLHLPDNEKHKNSDFLGILSDRLLRQQNNFEYVYFSDSLNITGSFFADRNNFEFSSDANFNYAIFVNHVWFNVLFNKPVYFQSAEFRKAVFFQKAEFLELANFSNASFYNKAFFHHAFFKSDANFYSANFTETSHLEFIDCDFRNTLCLRNTEIMGYLTFTASSYNPGNKVFNSEDAVLDLQDIKIGNPERVSFRSMHLRPNWFINADCRKIFFTVCDWKLSIAPHTILYKATVWVCEHWPFNRLNTSKLLSWSLKNDKYAPIKLEVKTLEERGFINPHRLLAKTCWQLADNSEESKNFLTASYFRKSANELKRLERYRGLKIWSLHWWYWVSSYYGESWVQAVIILFFVLASFAVAYNQTDFQICPSNQPLAMSITECKIDSENCKCRISGLELKEAVTHSVATALFQNVEYRKPLTVWGEFLTYLEKILAPLQATLLALAIRRKFMR